MNTYETTVFKAFLTANNAIEQYRAACAKDGDLHPFTLHGINKMSAISGVFLWSETPEGHEFWNELSGKWREFYRTPGFGTKTYEELTKPKLTSVVPVIGNYYKILGLSKDSSWKSREDEFIGQTVQIEETHWGMKPDGSAMVSITGAVLKTLGEPDFFPSHIHGVYLEDAEAPAFTPAPAVPEPSKLQFKVGDRVRVISAGSGHAAIIGKVYVIERVDHSDCCLPYRLANVDGGSWVSQDYIEAAHPFEEGQRVYMKPGMGDEEFADHLYLTGSGGIAERAFFQQLRTRGAIVEVAKFKARFSMDTRAGDFTNSPLVITASSHLTIPACVLTAEAPAVPAPKKTFKVGDYVTLTDRMTEERILDHLYSTYEGDESDRAFIRAIQKTPVKITKVMGITSDAHRRAGYFREFVRVEVPAGCHLSCPRVIQPELLNPVTLPDARGIDNVSEEAKNAFIGFLIANNAYAKYVENVACLDQACMYTDAEDLIMDAFSWEDTDEGYGFWDDLDDDWRELVEEKGL